VTSQQSSSTPGVALHGVAVHPGGFYEYTVRGNILAGTGNAFMWVRTAGGHNVVWKSITSWKSEPLTTDLEEHSVSFQVPWTAKQLDVGVLWSGVSAGDVMELWQPDVGSLSDPKPGSGALVYVGMGSGAQQRARCIQKCKECDASGVCATRNVEGTVTHNGRVFTVGCQGPVCKTHGKVKRSLKTLNYCQEGCRASADQAWRTPARQEAPPRCSTHCENSCKEYREWRGDKWKACCSGCGYMWNSTYPEEACDARETPTHRAVPEHPCDGYWYQDGTSQCTGR